MAQSGKDASSNLEGATDAADAGAEEYNPLDGLTSDEIVRDFHPNTKDAFQKNFSQLTVAFNDAQKEAATRKALQMYAAQNKINHSAKSDKQSAREHICRICSLQNSKLCTACLSVAYCCRKHQRSDWKRHKPKCKELQAKKAGSSSATPTSTSSSSSSSSSKEILPSFDIAYKALMAQGGEANYVKRVTNIERMSSPAPVSPFLYARGDAPKSKTLFLVSYDWYYDATDLGNYCALLEFDPDADDDAEEGEVTIKQLSLRSWNHNKVDRTKVTLAKNKKYGFPEMRLSDYPDPS